MKKWKVLACIPSYYSVEVEAENEKDAVKKALALDTDEWEDQESVCDWILPDEGSCYEPSADEA